MQEFTEPLRSGAKVPVHPESTTSRKVVRYGEVRDSKDGHPLTAGLHRNEITMLRQGTVGGLGHTYRFAMVQEGPDLRIYHTRSRVIIEVETIEAEVEDG